jgi:LmbE family N-acetylglucosaminyl deacetylase
MMSDRRLLGIFAHPNDEELIAGALLRYHSLGVKTGLVCATRGEVGIADSVLATPENLGQVRETEMRTVTEALHVDQLWFLGYRDSGMAGTIDNQDPRALIKARAAKVIGELVAIIRQFRPQVIVTFDETGGSGHPDHIIMYKYVTGAFHSAADGIQYPELGPAHAAAKLYYTALARRQIIMMTEWLQDQTYEGFVYDLDVEKMGFADDQIDVMLDVGQWQEMKAEALGKHRLQMRSDSPFSLRAVHHLLPYDLQRRWRSTEYFRLATSRVGSDNVGDNDLFAHVP